MPDCSRIEVPAIGAWQASLALGFGADGGRTRLLRRVHSGPLRVQKALYPEGDAVCHAIIVHPPGGVVGGDQLALEAHAGAGAAVFLTTPGAAKWYKANGRQSGQRVRLRADAGASIEWMPQESIFFDQARVALEHSVALAPDATYIGCEILCLGRRAAGETFRSGRIGQRSEIRRGGRLIWCEQGALEAGGALAASPFGLAGHSVCATLLAAGPAAPAAALAGLRAAGARFGPGFGATQLKSVLVARYLGHDSEAARLAMLAAWGALRPHLLGRPGCAPRSWNT